ncbi:HTH-type transcriptional regulator YjdC [Poriferisphaera corsica]|uniref:HTH-type transcriptional regulator YjdC n=1 Tax=Poriferisphaera corsica TaxID=2528020 RepID=A0A517YVC8_9BACT|nr:TetR family transcriptional regulator [Poriferisphaera corsica]QDU34132.1 HTH-type transcriptional regulator YjdC [Poriferisphaera corsica]
MTQNSRREHLIDTAITLFQQRGYHATGIDKILAHAHVSKKTMYQHFRSKEELIYAALRKYDSQFRNSFMKEIKNRSHIPAEQLLILFDVAEDWFKADKFYGCMFISAVSEFATDDSTIRQICKQFKQLIHHYILTLAQEANLSNPNEIADELSLLLEGAIVTAQVSSKPNAAQTAKHIAKQLIQNQTK